MSYCLFFGWFLMVSIFTWWSIERLKSRKPLKQVDSQSRFFFHHEFLQLVCFKMHHINVAMNRDSLPEISHVQVMHFVGFGRMRKKIVWSMWMPRVCTLILWSPSRELAIGSTLFSKTKQRSMEDDKSVYQLFEVSKFETQLTRGHHFGPDEDWI